MIGNGMPQIGDVIAEKYRLDKVAGEGGMGIVYAAEHLVLKQRVAVKVLLPGAATSEAIVERFSREARAAAKINSEHVARVLDAGSTANGAPFLVMEYLEGCDLEELLEVHKTLPIAEAVDYTVQALEGLAHAHAANIVHRDLKPANLFLGSRPDGSSAIKLLDFGISKTTQTRPEDKRLTGQNVLGSPVYMSPEQLRNATNIDARADIWSIGVVLYEMLAGAPPFDGDGVGEIFAGILEKDPVPLCATNTKIPQELSDIVGRCLRRDPGERWEDVGALARALAPFAKGPLASTIERTEQVLARSKQLHVLETPMETRRVVEAIEAATSLAISSVRKSEPLLLTKPKSESIGREETLGEGVRARVVSFARRSPVRTATAAVTLAVIIGLFAFGALRAVRSSSAAEGSPAGELPSAQAGSDGAEPGNGADGDQADSPLLMDLPETANGDKNQRARGSKAKGTKPVRPKFLNSRE